jgi:hypothetical protein
LISCQFEDVSANSLCANLLFVYYKGRVYHKAMTLIFGLYQMGHVWNYRILFLFLTLAKFSCLISSMKDTDVSMLFIIPSVNVFIKCILYSTSLIFVRMASTVPQHKMSSVGS